MDEWKVGEQKDRIGEDFVSYTLVEDSMGCIGIRGHAAHMTRQSSVDDYWV